MRPLRELWKPVHGKALPICEMNDGHLLNSIIYVRDMLLKIRKSKLGDDKYQEWLELWIAVVYEAGARQLVIDLDHRPPHPNDFAGMKYEKRTVHKAPKVQRPFRGARDLDC